MFSLVPFMYNDNSMSPVKSIFDAFDNSLFMNNFSPVTSAFNSFKVDLKDTGNAYELTADLPGVKKDDIKLDCDNGYLTISAKMDNTQNKTDEANNFVCQERYVGSVQRSFYVGDIDKANSTANYDNGVLKVTMPKAYPSQSSSHIDVD